MSLPNHSGLSGADLAIVEAEAALRRRRPGEVDPLAAVIALGDRAARIGAVAGIVLALLLHGAASARAITSLHDMWLAMKTMRDGIHDFFWTVYDVDLPQPEKPPEQKPPEPPPEPEPEPAPAPKVAAPAPKEEDPYEPPPAPAQAAKVLTAPEDPGKDKIEDLTDQGFVSGEGQGPGYGIVSAAGTGTAPVFNPNAKVGGVPGGTGTGPPRPPPPPPPPGPDRSHPANLAGGTSWNCPFPPEADADQIDTAVAVLVITVRPDGSPLSVQVVSDPGHGFGRAARICALGKRYTPGADREGSPITSTMPPVKVRFSR